VKKPKGTTKVGYVNPNRQVVIRNTGKRGTDNNARVYQIACSHCGYVYGANGTDIFERKCPKCGQGQPGLSI
jgi:PHP family Zn ribbon phosphoesterase